MRIERPPATIAAIVGWPFMSSGDAEFLVADGDVSFDHISAIPRRNVFGMIGGGHQPGYRLPPRVGGPITPGGFYSCLSIWHGSEYEIKNTPRVARNAERGVGC